MKTHPNDASNKEVIQTIVGAIEKLDKRVSNVEVSTRDILEAMHAFAGSVDQRFDAVDQRFEKIESDIGEMKVEMVTKNELWSEMNKLKTTMVTKGYLDDKLAEHHSDLVQWTRREIARSLPNT